MTIQTLNNPDLADFPEDSLEGLPGTATWEDERAYHIEMFAPGLRPGDFRIQTHCDMMAVLAAREVEQQDQNGCYTRKISLHRCFTLPTDAATDSVEISYEKGKVHLAIAKLSC